MANIIPKALKKENLIAETNLEEFRFLDADNFIEENKVEHHALESAKKQEPASAALNPDHNELRFHQLLSQLATRATGRLNERLGEIRRAIAAIDIVGTRAELDNAVNLFRADMQAEIRLDLENLNQLRTFYNDEKNDFEKFKKENGLTRSATYKESMANTLGWLAVCLMIESFANTGLLASASQFGQIGGLSLAVAISGMNIVLGFILGFFFLPRKNLINARVAWAWFIAFIAGLVVVVCVNLLIAHYREVLIIDPANSGLLAVERFTDGMFNLTDVLSIFLFLIGVIVSGIAIWKGYTQEDPYPGYSKLDKKKQHLNQHFDMKQKAEISSFKTEYEKALKLIEDKQNTIQANHRRYHHLTTDFNKQIELYKAYIRDLKLTGTRVITLYRDTNRQAREDEPPNYFNEDIIIDIEAAPIDDEYDDIGEELNQAEDATGLLIPRLKSEFIETKDEHQKKLLAVNIQ